MSEGDGEGEREGDERGKELKEYFNSESILLVVKLLLLTSAKKTSLFRSELVTSSIAVLLSSLFAVLSSFLLLVLFWLFVFTFSVTSSFPVLRSWSRQGISGIGTR